MELVCPPPGRGAACTPSTPYSGAAAALVPCTSTRTATGRPPPRGDWFAAEDEFIPAMEHYHAARDFERALSVMERDMARHLVTESAAFFARLFQDCPEEVLARHPKAAFKHALAALSASDFPAFADRCRWLARYCAALDEAHPATPVLRGELEMLLALAEYNDIAAMSVRHRRAWELLGRPTGLYPPESTWSMAAPPCCSCSTGKAATSGRKSG